MSTLKIARMNDYTSDSTIKTTANRNRKLRYPIHLKRI